jgi:hypothetical protein
MCGAWNVVESGTHLEHGTRWSVTKASEPIHGTKCSEYRRRRLIFEVRGNTEHSGV